MFTRIIPGQVVEKSGTLYSVVGRAVVSGDDIATDTKAFLSIVTFLHDYKATGGIWLLLFLKPSDASDIAIIGGESPEELHVTVAQVEPNGVSRDVVTEVIQRATDELPLVVGKIGGVGQFYSNGDIPVIALFDSPDLNGWRDALLDSLEAVGVTAVDDHGYTPHVTLMYTDEPLEQLPLVDGRELVLDTLSLVWDGERRDFRLTESDVKGGPGSGHHGHAGRPGKRGGSAPDTGMPSSAREFSSRSDAQKWASEGWSETHDSLSSKEKSTIKSYSGHAYDELNLHLRTGEDPDAFWISATLQEHGGGYVDDWFADRISTEEVVSKFTDPLDSAISKGEAPSDFIAYRGLGSSTGSQLEVGSVFQDKAYVSTSLLEESATRFVTKGGFVARILVPKGSKSLYLGNLAGGEVQHETEVLLPRGSSFKVVGARSVGDYTVLDIELLP